MKRVTTKTIMLPVAAAFAALVLLAAGRASATTLTDSQIFGQFNAVVFGNFSSGSDVQGRTVVGGNLTGSGTNFEINSGLATSSFGALTVYGSASGSSFQVNNGAGIAIAGANTANFSLNGGSAYVGGNNSGNLNAAGSLTVVGTNTGAVSLTNGGSVYLGSNGSNGSFSVSGGGTTTVGINGNNAGTVTLANGTTLSLNGNNTGSITANGGNVNYTGSPGSITNLNGGTATQVGSLNLTAPASTLGSFAATFQTPLTQLSTQLNGVAANSTATLANNTLTFNASPNASGIAIFDVNSSQFTGASSVAINLDGATSVIINVNVNSCASNVCTFAPTANFLNDTSYAGTVLWNFINATNLNFTTEIGGSILAPIAAVTDSTPIDGTLVAASFTTSSELHSYSYTGVFPGTATPAPEPASLALVGTGFAGLAAVRRRRRC